MAGVSLSIEPLTYYKLLTPPPERPGPAFRGSAPRAALKAMR
jgi:hypothetical protein